MAIYYRSSLTALTLLLCVGCAASSRRAEIPLGEWSGEGVFVAYGHSGEPEEGAPPNVLDRGTYETQLAIADSTYEGEQTTRLEILSQRGEHEHLEGDRTHLIAHLRLDRSIDEGTIALYRLAGFGISFDEDEPDVDRADGDDRPFATCMAIEGEVVLRIHYLEGYVDTLRFRAGRACKDGSYAPEADKGVIHWSERMKRKR